MYLKPRQRRRRGISFRRLFFLLVLFALTGAAIYTYMNQDTVVPIIRGAYGTLSANVNDTVSTIAAPTPTPTKDPGDDVRLAESAWSSGSYQEAVRLYGESINALPNDVKAHYYLTLGLVMQGRLNEAVEAAENTVTANPFAADSWAIRAMALNRVGRYADSIVSALRALELDPKSARARAFLAESYMDNGQATRAESALEEALDLKPDSFEAHYVSGMYQWEVAYDFVAAREELQNAYDLSRGASHIGLSLARLQVAAFQNLDAATELLKDILDRNPDNAPVLYQLGVWSWRNNGNSEQAETYLRRCTTAAPDDIFCHYELGRVLVNLGQVEDARRAFERVIELGSTNPYHYFWAGQIQIQANANCGAAMRYWQQGAQIVRLEIDSRSTLYNSTEALQSLLADYQDVMSPCGGAPLIVPTVDPDAEATPEA
jgi:tetratricopeptide (TPR) repeat protein